MAKALQQADYLRVNTVKQTKTKEIRKPAYWSHNRRALFKMDSPTRRQLVVGFLEPAKKTRLFCADAILLDDLCCQSSAGQLHRGTFFSQKMFTPPKHWKNLKLHFWTREKTFVHCSDCSLDTSGIGLGVAMLCIKICDRALLWQWKVIRIAVHPEPDINIVKCNRGLYETNDVSKSAH